MASVAKVSLSCPTTVLYTNKILLDGVENPVNTEEVMRIAAQIRELNKCLDGELTCGLTYEEIKLILDTVSTY